MENNSYSIIKYGYKTSRITLNSTTHYPTYLELKKQLFYCKDCQTTFSVSSACIEIYLTADLFYPIW
ncbi:transposase family protein [Carnobacterium jeotgali]